MGREFGEWLWLWVLSEHPVSVSRGKAYSAEGDLGLCSVVGTSRGGIPWEKKD